MEQDKSAEQILLDAANQLEFGEWGQGAFFQRKNNNICMCAHGAIKYCGNITIKFLIDRIQLPQAMGRR